MNGDLNAKFIWACIFLFVYGFAGEIFLSNIVKMNLTNLQRRKSPQLLDQSKQKNMFQSMFYQQIHFNQIKSKMAANNMSNNHISPDNLSTLLLLPAG